MIFNFYYGDLIFEINELSGIKTYVLLIENRFLKGRIPIFQITSTKLGEMYYGRLTKSSQKYHSEKVML